MLYYVTMGIYIMGVYVYINNSNNYIISWYYLFYEYNIKHNLNNYFKLFRSD